MPDTDVVLTEAELDAVSKKNVERWVSAHIIPVSWNDQVCGPLSL